jgi:hypothetical protein
MVGRHQQPSTGRSPTLRCPPEARAQLRQSETWACPTRVPLRSPMRALARTVAIVSRPKPQARGNFTAARELPRAMR